MLCLGIANWYLINFFVAFGSCCSYCFWVCNIALNTIAEVKPQASSSAVIKSLQFKWNDILQVIPNCESLFIPLCTAINTIFYPLTGGPVS